jgi:hypothetical protein
MAAVAAGANVSDTTNNAPVGTGLGALSLADGDLLIAIATVSGQASGGTFSSDTQSLGGWTVIATALKNTSFDSIVVAVANALAVADTFLTVTFTPAGGPTSTGVNLSVLRVSGMTRTGSAAIRQSAKQDNQTGTFTPAPTFSVAALTGNPTIGAVGNGTNPATLTAPASWTEVNDIGYAAPTNGLEVVSRDSGFTGTTVTWGSSSASAWGSIIIELDTSAPFALPPVPRIGNVLPHWAQILE